MPTFTDTELWLLARATSIVLCVWLIWWGGAERLEGSILSALLIDWWAPRWSAQGIKLVAWVWLIAAIVALVVGMLVPELRCWPLECRPHA